MFTITMTVAAIEAENITRSILFLALSSVGIGSIFFLVGANYAAVFEFVLYAGVLIVLFIVASSLTETTKIKTNGEDLFVKEIKP
jgi:NADH:ubiquinone oxidoreductase subunit 6 (subunit J)